MIIDNKLSQIKLFLDNNLVNKYVGKEVELFPDVQDYCRFMFAIGIIKLEKNDKMLKYFEVLKNRKEKKQKQYDYKFGEFNKNLRMKDLVKHHFSYLDDEIEVFDCINAVIIKAEELLKHDDSFNEHFLSNNYIDLENILE